MRSTTAAARTAGHAAALSLITMLLLAIASLARAQPAGRPFAAGEVLRYEATYGRLRVGEGRLEVRAVDTVRGRPAWHLLFELTGGIPLYRIDDRLESWVDTATFTSRRFTKRLQEGRRKRTQRYEILPEEGVYEDGEGRRAATVASPLDDGAFFYYVRTLPLRVGDRYSLPHYFRPDRNPVAVTVHRRERVRVPAGEFDAVVLRPVIRTTGLLAESRRTELWITDDDARILVQVQSHLPVGTITLRLTEMSGVRSALASAGTVRVVE